MLCLFFTDERRQYDYLYDNFEYKTHWLDS